MPNTSAPSLTDNPRSEGTYRMYLEGRDNRPVMIPFSNVPDAQNLGFKFHDDDERGRWRKDYDHSVRRLPLFSQARWDAENATFPDDFLDNTLVSRAMDTISRPVVHPLQTMHGIWELRKPIAAAGRYITSYGSDVDAGREFLDTNPVTARWREAKDDYQRGGSGYAAAKALGDLAGGVVAGEVGGVAGKAIAPPLARTMGTLGKVLPEHAVNVINKTMGAGEDTLNAGNPGRAYFHESDPMNVSSGWKSVEQKAQASIAASDRAVQAAADEATTNGLRIPASEVEMRLKDQMGKVLAKASRDDFPGEVKPAIEQHWQSLQPYFEHANAQGGFTPADLWELNGKIAKGLPEDSKPLMAAYESHILKMLKDAPGMKEAASDALDLRALRNRAEAMRGKGPSPSDFTKAIGRAGAKIGTDAISGHLGPASIFAATLPELPALLPEIMPGSIYASGMRAAGQGFSRLAPKVASSAFPAAVGGTVRAADLLAGQTGHRTPFDKVPTLTDTPIPAPGGPNRWITNGAANVLQHLAMYPTGLSTEDLALLTETPEGQRILINAGNLTPGSKGMHALVTRISDQKRGGS